MAKKMTLQVFTNDGKTLETTADDYSAKEVLDQLADTSSQYIAIGDLVIAKHSFQRVVPVESKE